MVKRKYLIELLDLFNWFGEKKSFFKSKKKLFKLLEDNLLNCKITTPPLGDYEGGTAKIIEIFPDPMAPEIIFQVYNPKSKYKEMGIFYTEPFILSLKNGRKVIDNFVNMD